MKFSAQLLEVRDALAAWARASGGTAEIAGDSVHLMAILAAKPGSVRACVFAQSESKRGEHEEAGMVDRRFTVIISRGKGFTLEKADSLVLGSAGGAPLFDLVEEARDIVRGLSFTATETEVTPDYQGWEPARIEIGRPVDAYQLNFSIGCQLPDIAL